MLLELISVGILVTEYLYHRWHDEKAEHEKPIREIQIPRTDEGAPVPLIYGQCRVDAPILAWTSTLPETLTVTEDVGSGIFGGYIYMLDMFFILGMSVAFGNSTSRLLSVYVGPFSLLLRSQGGHPNVASLSQLEGTGGYERNTRYAQVWNDAVVSRQPYVQGEVEFLNGGRTQLLVDQGTLLPLTRTGEMMIDSGVDPERIPGYRGYLAVSLSGVSEVGLNQFDIGGEPSPPDFGFEVSSYPLSFNALATGSPTIGVEMNPADVIIDILRNKFAKLGLSADSIDRPSFQEAAATLKLEEHGYSRAFQETQDADEMIKEILEQIDAVIFEDPVTGKIKIKLIRGGYDAFNVPRFSPANARLVNYAAAGWPNIVNKIRVVYSDRQLKYQDNSETAHNQASAAEQDGVVRELTLRYPGCCTSALALKIAGRELSARSRPIAKCSLEVSRAFYRTTQGDVVSLDWPEYGISGLLFRVANVDRGTLEDGRIRLDLIQEYFNTYRSVVSPPNDIAPFPTTSTSE